MINESKALFVDVILPLAIKGTLTYGVPFDWHDQVKIGQRVEVGLGKNKKYAGIVVHIHQQAPQAYQVKPILACIDDQPIVTEKQIALWQFIANYYAVEMGEVMNAALPSHLKMEGATSITWAGKPLTFDAPLSDTAYVLAEALELKKDIKLSELPQIVGWEHVQAVQTLIELGYAKVNDQLVNPYKEKTENRLVWFHDQPNDEHIAGYFEKIAKFPKQEHALLVWITAHQKGDHLTVAQLAKKAQVTTSVVEQLITKNILRVVTVTIDRFNLGQYVLGHKNIALTDAQATAYNAVKAHMTSKAVYLHGVTGSGKTLLYISIIRDWLAEGGTVLYLLPEIALTTQILSRLVSYFGEDLVIYHSHLSANERVEIWNKVRAGKAKIVLGARSAIWLPFDNLKGIIVDEEHESSYKQTEPSPRFHARDVALYMAQQHQCPIVLGSATPSLESWYNCQQGKFHLVALNERYQQVPMPAIHLIEQQSNALLNSPSIKMFTPKLIERIQVQLQDKKQVILFQNRRGYAPFQLCHTCGWIPQCPNCAVSLTYHKSGDYVQCHYCNHKSVPVYQCLSCGSSKMVSKTYGTERVEEEAKLLFPEARIARMDWDSMKGKQSVNQLIHKMEKHQIDILIGTQMVVKGLDFEGVRLVGVMGGDQLLAYPDFRSLERGFQMLVQVSGRTGRLDGKGEVYIQTYNQRHPVYQFVQEHAVQAFLNHELQQRQQFAYPPYCKLIAIHCKHTEENKAAKAAQYMAEALKGIEHIQVIGPSPALVPRVRNKYIMDCLVKMPRHAAHLQHVKSKLFEIKQGVAHQKQLSNVQIVIDVDPM